MNITCWVERAADNLNDDQDALFADRLQPALNGILDQAFKGVPNTCTADEVGRNLAVELVQNPTAVRVRIFEAGLFAVVARVLTEQNSRQGYTNQELTPALYNELAISLKQLSETYLKLNPDREWSTSSPADNFLDPLWRMEGCGLAKLPQSAK